MANKNVVSVTRFGKKIVKKIFKRNKTFEDYIIPEIEQIPFKKSNHNKTRINLLTTSINENDMYAGIKTAVDFFYNFSEFCDADMRIISMDKPIDENEVYLLDGFKVGNADDTESSRLIIDMSNRDVVLPVSENDIFIATMWHTVYSISDMLEWYKNEFTAEPALIYLIQDYEPGFFPWSSRYMLAESTYKLNVKTIAVFNSFTLKEYFNKNKYHFFSDYVFSPKLNNDLKKVLVENKENYNRKNQILIYGRPSKSRNAFELIVMALDRWYQDDMRAKDWEVLSAGQSFKDIECKSGLKIKSIGKLTIEDYAKTMLETKIGISLMVSPHPSYPPLEMATFGIKVITNQFSNKNLDTFNENIVSIENTSTFSISRKISELITEDIQNNVNPGSSYLDDSTQQWTEIYKGISKDLKELGHL